MTSVQKLSLIAAGLLALSAFTGAAEVFTATGNDGEKVYSDKPSDNATKIKLRFAAPASATTPGTQPAPEFDEMSACEQARFIVQKYTAAGALAERGEDGEARVLSDAEANAVLEKAHADEQRLCEGNSDE